MSWYWIVAVLYTILNIFRYLSRCKDKKFRKEDWAPYIIVILCSILLTPVVLIIDICREIKKT